MSSPRPDVNDSKPGKMIGSIIGMHFLKSRIMNFILSLIVSFSVGCSSPQPTNDQSKPISHQQFDELLKKHVDADGWVNYDGFLKDREKLNAYLKLLKENAPNDSWTKDEQLAYWINAYNAFTVDLILQYYPLKSIRDIGSSIQIPFVNSPWDIKFIEIAGEKMDLNNIEHGIIRKNFEEPRIHFAVNCASYSCPVLRNEAYVASKLDAQLEEQTMSFINDPLRNRISTKRAEISKLFDWYKGDFTKNGSLSEFINQYASTKIVKGTKVSHLDYNWQLNKQE